ncbi:hypothetical protein Btru_014253 [Bulinus truncatus]|nr:hypothetical protein Btru_014253 [Bulinus truncatus]
MDNTASWIDEVAKANSETYSSDSSTGRILQKLKISPCRIFSRSDLLQELGMHQQQAHQRADNRNDALYSTSYHGISMKQRAQPAKRNNSLETQLQVEKEAEFLSHVHTGKAQKYFLPTLPTELMSNFVFSWVSQGASYHCSEQNKPTASSTKCQLKRRSKIST